MTKKSKITQIMAFLALFGIIIGIIGTGMLIFFSGNNFNPEQELTKDQYEELQKYINSQSGATIKKGSGAVIEVGTGKIK